RAATSALTCPLCSTRRLASHPALLHRNPHTPTATLAQLILLHSPLLSELVVARE
ncbi:hypothetical protein DFH11DRAFT_1643397, partial [Phellopilus nigrolimitatus]